jgi:Tat protein secretion system quality control protein TatD with DNase activity
VLERHWQETHQRLGNMGMDTINWGAERFEQYFVRAEALLDFVAKHWGLTDLMELYRHLRAMDLREGVSSNHLLVDVLVEPWTEFLRRRGLTVPAEGFQMDPINSPACLLHWRVLYRLLMGMTSQVRDEVKNFYPGAPVHPAVAGSNVEVVPAAVLNALAAVGSASAPAVGGPAGQSEAGTEQSMEVETSTAPVPAQGTTSSAPETEVKTVAKVVASQGTPGGKATARPACGMLAGKSMREPNFDERGYPVGYDRVDDRVVQENYLSDAHFHLDILCHEAQLQQARLTFVQGLRGVPGTQESYGVSRNKRVQLGYSVACFMLSGAKIHIPVNYGPLVADDSRVKLCFGAHPAHVSHKMSLHEQDKLIAAVIDHSFLSGVVAIGEIGLDYTRALQPLPRENQVRFLKAFLMKLKQGEKLARLRALPLVLHIREADCSGSLEATKRCLEILQGIPVPKEHRMYRHCFIGGPEEASLWLEAFPNTVFGFSPKSCSESGAHPQNAKAFLNLGLNRILVETDSPKLFLRGCRRRTTPWSTYELFWWIASLYGVSLRKVLETVAGTFESFFRLPPPSRR